MNIINNIPSHHYFSQSQRRYRYRHKLQIIREDIMIPDYTSSVVQGIVEDSSYLHIDDYTKKTILSKAGDFGTDFPRIVQDNARSFTSMPLSKNENKMKKMKKSKNRTRRQVIAPKSLMIPADFFKSEDLPLYNTPLTKPQERWSNGIMDVVKDANPTGSRFYSKRSMGKNLTAALARDLNISPKTLSAHTRLLPLDEESGRRYVSLNSIRTNPQHYLIRPERIPSNECLGWNSIQGQPKAPSENFRWEQISKPVSAKTPSLRNENKDAVTNQVSGTFRNDVLPRAAWWII